MQMPEDATQLARMEASKTNAIVSWQLVTSVKLFLDQSIGIPQSHFNPLSSKNQVLVKSQNPESIMRREDETLISDQ